jgi:Xaa-Pro aminopeptidase
MAGYGSAPGSSGRDLGITSSVLAARVASVRRAMERRSVDVVLLSVGADLPYLTGYTAMPLERLTMLVLPRQGDAVLVIPRLEAPRVVEHPDVFTLHPWNETEDPVAIVAKLMGTPSVAAIGDRTWAQFLIELTTLRPVARFERASSVVGAVRMRKDAAEIEALARAAAAADRVATQLQRGEIALAGRTEAQVSADISARLLAEGHDKVNFAIVAAGSNAASAHHEPSSRVITAGEVVLCDFGGTMAGYCSDITRCVSLGPPSTEVAEAYAVLKAAQRHAVQSALVGRPCQEVDDAARSVISDAGYGEFFVHRTGHGIGLDEHEDPYIVAGNQRPLEAGHAFSIEPGIYVPGQFGLRLEDIVVATETGPRSLNLVDHDLIVL